MKQKQILRLLSKAIEEETPDILDNILRSCSELETIQQKGQTMDITKTITNIPFHTNQKQMRSTLFIPSLAKWATAMAAMLILIITYFGYQHYTVDSIIDFDVNPSIELKINRAEKVLAAIPMNEDAKIILDDMNFKNVDLDIAVNAIIGSMLKNGYVNEIKNSILISVENSNRKKSNELQQKLSKEVSSLLDAHSIGGAVLSQTRSDDKKLISLAKEYNISVGKAQLIDQLIHIDSRLNFADISKLSINDINLLLANKLTEMEGVSLNGQASSSAYIGEEKAKFIALSQKKISESSLLSFQVQLDYEDGHMVYEVEFETVEGEYEYEIDASSGAILKEKIDLKKPAQNNGNNGNNTSNEDNNSNNNNGTQNNGNNDNNNSRYIGKGKAKSIAIEHAKLTHSDVTFTKVKLDKEDNTHIYEIEFYSSNKEYDYEINAITGEILEYDYKIKTYSPSKNSSKDKGNNQTNNNSSSAKDTDIGASKAKSIAFTHAKLKENQVKKISIESKRDDGRKVYEIEFTYNHIEYEYEIDAATGIIIEWNSNHDEDQDDDNDDEDKDEDKDDDEDKDEDEDQDEDEDEDEDQDDDEQ